MDANDNDNHIYRDLPKWSKSIPNFYTGLKTDICSGIPDTASEFSTASS